MSWLGCELPLIQAPMAGSQTSRLAIAVCQAGAIGSLPAAMLSPDRLRAELQALRAATDKPFNLNFFCHRPPPPNAEREAQWLSRLGPYYAEHGIAAASIPHGPGRAPFSAELAELIAEFKPPVLSFHFGLPDPLLLARVKQWGAMVLSTATTVEEARWLEEHGADAVIAQGLEAGGHRGHFLSPDLSRQQGLFALLPQVVAAVKVPVIAAGGIADAAGVRAALALGASAAQVGSAYLLCDECETSAIHRAALQSPAAGHTTLTHLFTGRPARGIVNRLMRELGPMSEPVPEFPLATSAIAPLRAAAEARGKGDFSPLWAGQNLSGCRPVPAGELTRSLAP
ncbi:nitronate monooxygenase [Pelomonas sp. SE-A7]|uniref:NAD(P)H-dependent flavin oxidoreductase n=1 Tax=Pelomonas sp. SE-A7 TaxID=3054953 RepID=UPI00259C7ED3|nr:nitronate monooxygenase [Pelomonas sp. SE-A7]MDM4766541.1 nitronate monooxygenase [Pelomonas sp. SE-A7]